MRYEDASHTGAFQGSQPIANDDLDSLPAGSRSPATGNLISGEGTQSGSAGADVAAGAHVTAIAGKGGEDTSFAGGKLSVVGEHGKLSVDAAGNYTYQANGGEENVRDRFTYTLADNNGATDTGSLIVEIGKTPVVIKANAQQIVPGPDGVVTLPPGVELSDIRVVGRNLVIDMPDGTQLIIVDGAIFVPQLVLGGVEIPSTNLAALLIGQEPQPAAGETPPSSGGNFAVPPPPLDPGVPLGDLIPPTEYTYKPPEPQETFLPEDREPTIEIQPDGQPASVSAVDSVDEDGLPGRDGNLPDEPPGSDEGADGNPTNNSDTDETTAGTIIIDSPDGIDNVTINGVLVTGAIGQVIQGQYGTLTITGFSGQNILYSYTLTDNTSGDNTHDDFSVTITDDDGDQATATLTIDIIDDVPTARNDTDTTVDGVATGNVMTDASPGDVGDSDTNAADTVGADNASLTSVSGFGGSNDSTFEGGLLTVNGQFGVLTIDAQGNYTYTVNPNAGGGGVDVFTYTLTDGDGDTTQATLTITNPDLHPDLPNPDAVLLDDDALTGGNPGGTGDDVDSQGTPGQLVGSGGDGDLDYFFAGPNSLPPGFTTNLVDASHMQILQGGTVVLTITLDNETGAFSVVQNNPIDHPAGLDENNLSFGVGVEVKDADGDTDPATITINVDDDTPVVNVELNREGAVTVDESGPTGASTINFGGTEGDDEHVPGSGPIGRAVGSTAIVDANALFGADGPSGSGLTYSLQLGGTDTPLTLTDGSAIQLQLINGVIVGMVTEGSHSGEAAFAIAINPTTGVATVELYLSLDHPDITNPNDSLPLGPDTVDVVVSATDGDGDTTTSDPVDVSGLFNFLDDGPSVDPELSADGPAIVDESPPVAAPTIDTGPYAKGDDPDLVGGQAIGSGSTTLLVPNAAFGADGPAASDSLTFALSVINPSSGLTLTDGSAINLVLLPSGVVVGVVSGGAFDGQAAFAISIDASTGTITAELYLSLDHPVNPDPNDVLTLDPNSLGAIVTATDGDGDTATSGVIDIGGKISFLDDGPTIDPSVNQEATVTVDESLPSTDPLINTGIYAKGDDPDLAGGLALGQANSGSAIVDANAVFGADGPAAGGGISYALSILNPSSGLTLTDGSAINLVMQGGVIVGVVAAGAFAGQAAFAIAINSTTGVVSMEQYLSLDHPINPNPNDPLNFGSDIIGVTVTATDGDGDPVTSDAVDIGGQLTFLDDGPSANNDTDTTDPVTDEAVGNVITGVGTTEGAANHDVPGADGFGAISNLVGFNGSTDSNPAGGFDVSGEWGTLHMDASGQYTYTRTGGAGGATDTFTYTYLDGDGDSVSATLTITLADNTPTLPDPDLIRLDDDVIPGKGGILDGPGDDDPDTVPGNVVNGQLNGSGGDGTLTYSFTGTNTLPTGFTVNVVDGDTIQVLQGVTVVMTIDLNTATGAFTVTQNNPIVHPSLDGEAGDNTENNLDFSIGVQVKDIDNDADSATITINVDDDSPVAAVVATGQNVSVDETNGNQGDSNDVTGPLAIFNGVANKGTDADMAGPQFGTSAAAIVAATGSAYGADGAGTTVFGLSVAPGGVDSGLDTTAGVNIFLFLENGLVVGRVGATAGAAAAGPAAFALSIDPSTGFISMVEYMSINHPNTGNPDDSVSILNTAVQATVAVTDSDGDTTTNSVNIGSHIQFQDDGPTAAVVATGQNVGVDETNGNQGDSNDVTGPLAIFNGVANKGTDADMAGPQFGTSAAAIVAATGSAYGADGAGTTVFGLSVAPGGVDSGLDTTAGVNIFLFLENGLVVGRVGATAGAAAAGPAAFALSIDPSTGFISMVEYMSINHPNTGNPDDSVSILNTAVQATVTVTDGDSDPATTSVNIGSHIQFQDDGPTAGIATTGQTVSLDESAGNQVDSNDVTGPIAAFAGVANVGDDPDVAGTGPIQFATSAAALVAATGSAYGADGAGTTLFGLSVAPGGVDSGLDTTAGVNIFLFLENGVVVGRVGATAGVAAAGPAAFALSINPTTGVVSMVEYLSIYHPNAANPDDSVSIINTAVQATVTVTDGDSDTATNSVNIGSLISFQDSAPIMTSASNINIQNSGDVAHTGAFAFNLGADGANTSNDVITNVTGGATVGGVAVTNWILTPGAENATTANYSFSFDYPIGGGNTAHETGTLVFDKVAGTYTIDLANPIQGVVTILQTATGTLFQGYEFGTSTLDNSQPAISVTQIQDLAGTANDIYVQFTSVAEPSSGTGNNALEVTNWVPGADNPPPIDAPPNPDASDFTWNPGQVFNQTDSWVSTSNDSNGVAGDTIQGGEVLDFNLVQGANPTGTLASPATYAQASSMFLKFDGIGTSEDMIVVLKVYDTVAHTYSTVALMVQNSDIQKGPGSGPGIYSGITLDQNDGLIVIEPNDYQQGNTNLVIVGAQIAGSDEGVSGTAIDFNYGGVLGVASTGTQAFSTDVSDGPFKISSIGFTTTQTTPQNAQLDFNVTVTDGDGDSITQAISATVTAAADSSTPISLDPSVTTIQSTLPPSPESSSLLVSDSQLQKTAANSNTLTLAAAVAAAGVAESAAAAGHQDFGRSHQNAETESAVGHVGKLADSGSGDDSGHSALPNVSLVAANDSAPADSSSHSSDAAESDHSLDDSAASAAAQSSDAPAAANDQGPAQVSASASPVAPTVAMVSAEALQAAGINGEGHHHGSVEQVVAEALGQGNAPAAVDAILNALPGGNGALAALANVASPAAGGVPAWDMAGHGAFAHGADMLMNAHVANQHHDAVQPVVNG
ncbi:DUF5801 domain-containing protein [Sphingomonas sp. G124]|uniref:DUF5801 domain-containing protein n=1 Tax=Sphingomonas cremea TaxID=2904799 RepID=A0A9X1QKU2_9SPHN|nr:DUF5801 repeats-in-toxin domain-containing protein [Sphingomonas cremea]MCF2515235.1 DUF5801 domain-containing protein [Sphingomonas cremea]